VHNERHGLDRRQALTLGAGAVAGLAITPQAIAQAPKGGPLRQVTIGTPSGNTGATLMELLRQEGFLEEYGLDAKVLSVSDGSKIVSAVLTREVDICRASGFSQVLLAMAKGGKLKVCCGASVLITQAMFTAKPYVKTLKDLEGRNVGTGQPGALLHHMTVALLKKHGVDLDKVKFVNIGSSADVFRAVIAGTIDAGPSQIDVYEDQSRFGVRSIADFWTELPEYPYQAGYSSDRTIAEKRDLLVRTLAAFGKLYAFIQSPNSMAAYVKAYVKATNGKTQDAEGQWRFTNKYKPYDLMLSEEKINFLQKVNVELKAQSRVLPIDQIADLSMAREALKMIG
jgi:ABC-type nitrate/sulfonate/bicarbonate transport system substrate-binding protein